MTLAVAAFINMHSTSRQGARQGMNLFEESEAQFTLCFKFFCSLQRAFVGHDTGVGTLPIRQKIEK